MNLRIEKQGMNLTNMHQSPSLVNELDENNITSYY